MEIKDLKIWLEVLNYKPGKDGLSARNKASMIGFKESA